MINKLLRYINKVLAFVKANKKLISISLTVLFAALIAFYISVNIQEFLAISLASPALVMVILITVVIRNFTTGMVMDTALRPLKIRLSVVESFGLATLTRLVNQVSPGKVGLIMRSMYLKSKYGFSYPSFVSSLAVSHVILYLVSSMLGLAAILILSLSGVFISPVFVYILLAAVISLLLVLMIPARGNTKDKSEDKDGKTVGSFLSKIVEGWHIIRQDRINIISLSFWSLVFVASSAIIMFSSFNALGADISIWMALFFSSINVVNAVIAITPSGFGVSEGIIVIVAHAAGIDTPTALSAALLQRAVGFFVVLLMAPFFSKKLFNATPRELLKKQFEKS